MLGESQLNVRISRQSQSPENYHYGRQETSKYFQMSVMLEIWDNLRKENGKPRLYVIQREVGGQVQ